MLLARAQTVLEVGPGGINGTWSFDHVFDASSGTEEVYRDVGETIISRGLEGHNGTIFAYGERL